MALDTVVKNGLNTAFKLLVGLKKNVTFKRKLESASYDFNARNASVVPVENVTVEAVVIRDDKVGRQTNSRRLQLLYKTAEVGDLSNFDEVVVDGNTWKISKSPLSETGHISFVEVSKEVKRG